MSKRHGFALREVLVMAVVVVVLGVLVSLDFGRFRQRSSRIGCVANLKEIGFGFRLFEVDHSDLLPQEVGQTNGGTLEIAASASSLAHFLSISNELSSPKILVCPADTRVAGQSWNSLKSTNVSYAVFLDTKSDNPGGPLSSDRNIILDGTPQTVMQINNPGKARWGTNMHSKAGYMLLRDGSASATQDQAMRRIIGAAGQARDTEMSRVESNPGSTNAASPTSTTLNITNRLAYP
jgi:hypothetical protein